MSLLFLTVKSLNQEIYLRTEQLFSGEKTVGPERKETILKGFSGFSVQVADPDIGSLADSWKNELQCRQTPPKAVKIQLKWPRDEQTDFEFETIVKIICRKQITQQ